MPPCFFHVDLVTGAVLTDIGPGFGYYDSRKLDWFNGGDGSTRVTPEVTATNTPSETPTSTATTPAEPTDTPKSTAMVVGG